MHLATKRSPSLGNVIARDCRARVGAVPRAVIDVDAVCTTQRNARSRLTMRLEPRSIEEKNIARLIPSTDGSRAASSPIAKREKASGCRTVRDEVKHVAKRAAVGAVDLIQADTRKREIASQGLRSLFGCEEVRDEGLGV